MQDRRFPPEWAVLQPSESPTFLLPSRVLAPSKYLVEDRKERRPHQNLTKANSFEKKITFSLAKVIWFGFPHDPNSPDNYQFSVSRHVILVWPLNPGCTHSPRN